MRSAVLVLALGMLAMGIPGCMENIALIGRPTIEEGRMMSSAKSIAWTFLHGGSICIRIAAIAESSLSAPMRRYSIVAVNIPWGD